MRIRNQKGLTLLEVLLSLVILTLILVTIMKFFPQMGTMNKQNEEKQQAVNLAKQELIEWQKIDLKSFLANPSASVLSEYGRFVDPYYIFTKTKDNYTVEVWLKNTSDLNNGLIKANMLLIKILNKNNNVISETYGYYLYKEG